MAARDSGPENAGTATGQALNREQQLYQDGAQLIKLRRDYFARYVPHKEKRLAMLTEDILSGGDPTN